MNWLLLSTIGLLAVCMFHGYKCGLVRMIFSVSSFLLTVVLVYVFAPAGVRLLQNNQKLYDAVKSPITDVLEEKIDGTFTIEEMLQSHYMLQGVSEEIINAIEESGFAQKDVLNMKVQEIMADCVTLKVIEFLVHLGLFLLIYTLLRVVSLILISVTNLPVVHEANQLAGCLLGMLEGMAVIWLFFIVVTIFSTSDWAVSCFEMIENSVILSTLYAYNPITYFWFLFKL